MIEIRPANSTAPAGDAPVGASRIEIRKKSSEPYYENQVPVSSFEKPPAPVAPEMGAGTIAAEGVKGLARGTLELATSIGGAGVEAAGQIGASAYDIARAPQTFPGMTPEQFQQMTAARQSQTPTPNPLEGQTQVAQQVYQADRPSLQPDPRTSPENAPYLTTQWGVPQIARLAGEAGSMVPAAAATIGAAAATGGIGPAGAFAGGAMGGAIEGLSEYQQVLESGGKPADALRAAAVMGAGSGALNAIPFVAYSTKFLPKGMRNSVGKAMISFLAEGATETAEGGVSAISRMNKLPKSADEWAEAYRKVEQGVIDESNVFLVAGLMGGGTSMLSKDDTQPQTPPPAPTATVPPTAPAPPAPIDALQPGPNAPTPNAYASFDEDNAPWVPQEPPVEAPEATTAPEAQKQPWEMTREEWDLWRIDELNRRNPQLGGALKGEIVESMPRDRYVATDDDGSGMGIAAGGHYGSTVTRTKSAPSGTWTHEIRHMIDMLLGGNQVRAFIGDIRKNKDAFSSLISKLKEMKKQGRIDKNGRLTDDTEVAQVALDAFYSDREGLREVAPDLVEFLEGMGADKYADLNLPHQKAVERAIAEGKPVPPEVLASYPDLAPAPEQQVAPEAPVEQLSPEYQALLDENPELAALLRAANQQPTAEQTALEQSILGQDLIDSREAKPPVEVRKPAPPLIEARPALDVGRPVEEQVPEPQTAREKFLSRVSVRAQDRPRPDANRPTVTPEPTNVRATVRNMSQKGLQTTQETMPAGVGPDVEEVLKRVREKNHRFEILTDEEAAVASSVDPNIQYLLKKIEDTERILNSDYPTDSQKEDVFAPALQEYKDRLSAYREGKPYVNPDVDSNSDLELLDRFDNAIDKYVPKGDPTVDRFDTYLRGIVYDVFSVPEKRTESFGQEIPSEAMKDQRLSRLGTIYSGNKRKDFDVTSKQNIDKVADAIFKKEAMSNGLDPEALLSPSSGWTKEKQKQELAKAKIKAQKMLMQIRDEVFPEMKEAPTQELPAPEVAALPKPAATFKGMQPRPRGQEPIPLYNIPDGKGGQTTVSAETAAAQGYSVPEPPEAPVAEVPKDSETKFQEDIRAISAEAKEKRLKDLRREFMQNKGLSHTQENGVQQILHMSSKKSGSFQLSSIGADGIPNMDQEFNNLSEAIAEFDRTVGSRRADLPDIAMMLKPGEANFIYEPRLRPVDIGTIPKEGFVGRREGGKWGRAAFNRPLTQRELDQYELTPVGYEDNTGGSGLIEDAMNEKPTTQEKVQALREKAKPKPKRKAPSKWLGGMDVAEDTKDKTLAALSDAPQFVDDIAKQTGLSLSDTIRDLTFLELSGKATQLPGKRFVVKAGYTPAPAQEQPAPAPKPKRTRKPKDTPPDITQQSMVEEESAYPESIQYDEEDVAYQYTQERLRKAFNVSTEDAQLLDAIISATGLNPKMLYVAAGSGSQRGVAGVSHSVKMGADRLRAAIIEGRSKSNTEAAIHEIAHAFRYILFDKDLPQSSRGNVTLDDIETARKWAGGKEGYNWGSEAEERFAQGFEKYLSTGKAPSSALERVFERLKQWIDKVYSTVIDKRYKARYDSISITPEMRDVFDRMLGKKEEAKKPKRGGDEAGYVNVGAIKEIGGIVFEAATKPVVFEQGFGQAKPAVAERRAKLKSFEMRGKHIAMDFDNGFRKLYKRLNPGLKGKLVNRFASIPDKIVNQLNDYLEQADPDMKAEALMELPPELREPAVKMRELIDNMTDYMLSLGIVEDEQGMAFADNKGVYLRRTYDIFTDPDFRERRDPRLKEALRKWLKKQHPDYSDYQIEGIITDLDGTGLSATSTNNMIARGKVLGQMDRRTLGRREDIPQEVMDFWGVSRNGYDRFLDTINSQAHIIANYELMSNFAENLNGISVATADLIRDIERGTYKGDNADDIMSWPRLDDRDTARAIRKETRTKTVTDKEQAIATALEKLGKLPDSQKKIEMVEKLRDDALMLKLGLKRDKAGVMSVDPENLESAAKYIEELTAEVSSRRNKKDKETAKLRKDLDKYTRQYNKAEGEAATDENLPNMFGSFGPMAGARIHPDLKKALQDALAIKERSEFVDALRGINSQMKQNVTTRNPASAVRNLTSGFDFSMANGWILYGNSVKRLGEAMAIANVDISRNHDPKLREWYLRAAELGVAGDTVVIGDITATAANAKKPKKIRNFIRKYPEIAAAMGGPDAVAQKLYQAGDDVFKIFGWLTETEHLMDIGMSRKEAEVEAALRVRNQFPTYSELPKWAQWFKASPVVGPFVAYKTETYRTAYNTVVQAVTEVKNKNPDKEIRRKIQRMGYRRLAGIGAASISRNALKIMLFAAFAIDPDDEDAIQMAAPVFYQDHTLGIVKANKAKGLYEGYNLSTSDAYNVLKEPMYAAIRGEGVGETVSNAAITIGRDYISPEMGASLIAELLANIQGKSSTIFKKSDTAGEKWLKSAMRVGLDVGVPGGARGFLKAETPEDYINEAVTQFTGLKTIKIDMPNDLLYKARALTAIPREQATDVYKYLRAKDKDGANAEIAKVNQTRKEQFMVVHKAYRAYASAGTRTDLLDDALKQAGLSQKSINNVKYGQYEDWEGSKPMKEALGQ